jgi:hypothetical protein
MAKQEPFRVAKNLIESGGIKTISDLLEIVDKRAIYKDIPTSAIRFNKLLDNTELFTFGDAYKIAQTIGLYPKLILDIIHSDWLFRRKRKK